MTDEEMAEEWVQHNSYTCLHANMNAYQFAECAFLAGLKAGRPEWHKVADGDLPKEEGEYLVCYETEKRTYRNTFILNYTEYDESLHWCDEAFETYDEGVIAWCEIPTYTEK